MSDEFSVERNFIVAAFEFTFHEFKKSTDIIAGRFRCSLDPRISRDGRKRVFWFRY